MTASPHSYWDTVQCHSGIRPGEPGLGNKVLNYSYWDGNGNKWLNYGYSGQEWKTKG